MFEQIKKRRIAADINKSFANDPSPGCCADDDVL